MVVVVVAVVVEEKAAHITGNMSKLTWIEMPNNDPFSSERHLGTRLRMPKPPARAMKALNVAKK